MKILIVGSGSWGTAVALHLAKHGHEVILWAHRSEHVHAMQQSGRNVDYLPDFPFPTNLTITADLVSTATQVDLTLIAVPSHAFYDILIQLPRSLTGLAWLTKGLDPRTSDLLSHLVAQHFGHDFPMTVISGPSFAREVAQGLPTAIIVAGNNQNFIQTWQSALHHKYLRAYISSDLIGVQLCGTIKNILAIACGASDGLGYGSNAKAALITRGLDEMTRLGIAMGAQTETFYGLAGIGDLILTCTDNQSRNRRFGLYLGQGIDFEDAEKQIGQVVEGKGNALQIHTLSEKLGINLPICYAVYTVITKQKTIKEAAESLLLRPMAT